MNKKTLIFFILFFIIIVISAYLNYTGIHWSLPNDSHYYSYHPDEGINIGGAIRIFGGAKEPGFYNYSSLYFYLVAYALSFASSFGILNLGETLTADNLRTIYLCGRMTSVIFSVLTVALVMLTGFRLKQKKIGLAAGLFCATCPIFVMHSKFIAVDVTCGFFVALAVFIATFINFQKERISPFSKEERKNFLLPLILSCVASGLAAGTKYNGLLIIIVPLCIVIFCLIKKQISVKDFILLLITGGFCTLLTFLITTPGVFLNTQQFIKDFTYELHHVKTGHGDEFLNTGVGLIYTFKENMRFGCGIIFSIFAIISMILGVFSKNKFIQSLSIFTLIYYISISTGQVRFARYLIPVLPAFSILIAFCIFNYISHKKHIILEFVGIFLCLLIFIPNLVNSTVIDKCMTIREMRDATIVLVTLENKAIGLPTVPWFYSPPWTKETSVMRQKRYEYAMACKEYNLKCQPEEENEWNVEYLKQEKPEYVIISSIESFHKERTKNPKYLAYMEYLNKDYEIASHLMNVYISEHLPILYNPNPNHYLPSDMTYIQPKYTIYHIKEEKP